MARLSRKQTDGHLPPRLSLAQPQREAGSLERSPKSDGCPRSPCKRQVSLIHHGNLHWLADGADLGRCGPYRSLLHASHRHASHHVLHAVHRVSSSNKFRALARWLGASRRRLGLAALGLGVSRRLSERLRHTFFVSLFRDWQNGRRGPAFRELSCTVIDAILARR